MDTESLKAKQADANTKFEELGQKINEFNEERLRLSGEFRALENLITEAKVVPEEANTITAEPKETTSGTKK